ncbi:MAG: bifunctional glutamate N-acetyltransferase/amino-acid acetyltransferase ArgJ [Myxococcota bacterium]
MITDSFRVPGFRAAGVHCGVKARRLDLALIASDVPAAAAGVFTTSTVVGAPVEWSRRHVADGRARAIVANSGCSNVAMGARGRRDAAAMAAAAAKTLGLRAGDVLVASTGVIGEPLPMAKIRRGVRAAGRALSPAGFPRAARAIMTTDTVPKLAATRVRLGGCDVHVGGIAKGSGMIEPDMATMLSFLATDADVAPAYLRRVLREVADASYNRLSIDGEGSTSDTVLLLANGVSGAGALRSPRSAGAARFEQALGDVAHALVRALARDGEGATRLVTVEVRGAASPADARLAARRIGNSVLVKTAVFGGDPNWGRILQTVGAGRVRLVLDRTSVQLGGVTVFRNGASAGPGARRRAEARLKSPEVAIRVDLGAGRASARLVTCDLTYDYVRINAEYTT